MKYIHHKSLSDLLCHYLIRSMQLFMLSLLSASTVFATDITSQTTNKQHRTIKIATLPQVYQVDIILFHSLNKNNIDPDIWQAWQPLNVSNAIQLQPLQQQPATNNNYFQLLPAKDFVLKNEARRLKRFGQYQLIRQLSWYQPIQKIRDPQPIEITAGRYTGEVGQKSQFTGLVSFNKTAWRYINFTAKVELTQPASGGLKSVTLTETRRILPNQLNYLDNSAFGMLVMVKNVNAKDANSDRWIINAQKDLNQQAENS